MSARSQPCDGSGALAVGLLLGSLIGLAIGLWNAPSSGKILRRRFMGQGETLRSKVESLVTGERVEDAIAEGRAVALQRQRELARR